MGAPALPPAWQRDGGELSFSSLLTERSSMSQVLINSLFQRDPVVLAACRMGQREVWEQLKVRTGSVCSWALPSNE